MDPRCAPPCVLPRHPSDQIADLPRHRRSARFSPPRLPCPEKPEPLAVLTDDGLGPDNYQGVAPAGPQARQDDPENPIRLPKQWPGPFPFQDSYRCRRARISVWSAARSAKISMILCMPERVSGVMQNSKVSAMDGINGRDRPITRLCRQEWATGRLRRHHHDLRPGRRRPRPFSGGRSPRTAATAALSRLSTCNRLATSAPGNSRDTTGLAFHRPIGKAVEARSRSWC